MIKGTMNVLIITDGTELIQKAALAIKESLSSISKTAKPKVKICCADTFKGDELLPADVFFLGCTQPSPPSFSWLQNMLSHINLASRKCGIFGLDKKTNTYLLSILKDSEAKTGESLLTQTLFDSKGKIKSSEIKKWVKQIIK